jgi:hypothetical protein
MSIPMSAAVNEQVAYESRVKLRYGVVAAIAGLFLVIAAVTGLAGPHSSVNEATIGLISVHKRAGLDLLGAIARGLAYLGLGVALDWLFRTARARNPGIAPFIRYFVVIGIPLLAVTVIVYQVVIMADASTFVKHAQLTYMQANAATGGSLIPVISIMLDVGLLLVTAGFIWVALNGMRVGLLTKGMGYGGIVAGVLVLFQVFGYAGLVLQALWLLALGLLFAGRWPAGIPAAWSSGKAEPWPTAAEVRAQRGAAAGRGRPGEGDRAKPARKRPEPAAVTSTATAVDGGESDPAGGGTRSAAQKRKRKRRR